MDKTGTYDKKIKQKHASQEIKRCEVITYWDRVLMRACPGKVRMECGGR